MSTECKQERLEFQACGSREVVGSFDGGRITSDAGGLLLREVERRRGIIKGFAGCFTDYRDPRYIEHSVEELIAQRVYGVALGYEDLNDHDELRSDALLGVMVDKQDPSGMDRVRERDRGKALAGKSTLNRLELTPASQKGKERYKKIGVDQAAVENLFVDLFLDGQRKVPKSIILDLDATDDPVHGNQEGRFFHGYYGHYCYLPLYITCGDFLLCAKLRPSNIDASAGSVEELERIISRIRARWPKVKIMIRGDGGFCREEIMSWCESKRVDFVLGLAKNERLKAKIEVEIEQAKKEHERTGRAERVFADFGYQTLKSWSRERRVIGKAEYLEKGANPRFIVTSLKATRAKRLYEKIYCARGDMENRIKEQQLDLFADRTSTATLHGNQLRLWFSSVAYVLMNELRRLALIGTEMARAQCGTIRTKLLKIGAQIKLSTRRIVISMASGYPFGAIFKQAYENLRRHLLLQT